MVKTKRINKKNIIQSLSPDDALNILNILIKEDRSLEEKVYQIAMQIFNDVDTEDITSDVYNELDMIDVEELWQRSGKTRYGYVDPSEESWVMFEEVLAPFIDEMKKHQKLATPSLAKKYCIGIIQGIQEFEKESNSDFKDWAVDAPSEYAQDVFNEWKKDETNEEDIIEVQKILKDGER